MRDERTCATDFRAAYGLSEKNRRGFVGGSACMPLLVPWNCKYKKRAHVQRKRNAAERFTASEGRARRACLVQLRRARCTRGHEIHER